MADTPGGGGSFLTQKYGPLAGWQWVATLGAAGGLLLWYRARKAQQAAAAQPTDTTGDQSAYGPLPGNTALAPIIIQQGPTSTPAPPAQTAPEEGYLTTSKVVGPQRQYVPTSGKTLADLLVKSGLLTKGASVYDPVTKQFTPYKTTAKYGGPIRPFNPNNDLNVLTAALLKAGVIIPRATAPAPPAQVVSP
jgi:hypothetical protein